MEFSDAIVTRADVIALRDRVSATVDDTIDEASSDVTILCRDGRRLHHFVEHAIGSLQRPMSDDDLARKFHGLVDPVLGSTRADELIRACGELAAAPDLRAITALARP